MEPSLSLDPNIILRSSQGEARFGARVAIDPESGEMRADMGENSPLPEMPQATLRAVSGRWLLDAVPEARIGVNGVAVGGARIIIAGDVITIAGSQLLVEEANSQALALRRFELEGTETLPPVGDSVQTLVPLGEDVAIDMGDVPAIDGVARARTRREPLNSWHYVGGAVGVVLLGLLVFFMMLETVTVDLKPADARVGALGKFSWQSASSVFVFPGQHTLQARREGFSPAEVRVDVQRGQPAQALLHLIKLPGKLAVDSGGVAAQISADGAPLGQVPGTVDVPAGEHTLTFKAPRYLEHVQRVVITGGGERQTLKVALKPSFGVVTVASIPAGATVEVDGKAAGVTPAKIEMDSGMRRVQISAPGLRAWISSVAVTAGASSSIGPVELGAADARVTVRSVPSGSQVTTGGTFRGVTPVTIDLSPGVSHAITIARAGYAPWTREVFAEPAKESTLDARLAALLVEVRIQGEPADAEVFLNGGSRGKAPVTVSLPASRHKLEVRREGYDPLSRDLVLAPGIGRTIDYKLVNPKDIVGNSPARLTTKSGIRLLIVPGGTFVAGTDRREQGRRPNEGSHKVTLLRPFYMGEREITNAQFRKFRENHDSGAIGNQSLDLDKQAVSRVTWDDAAEFCNWLSTEEGLPPAYQPRDGGGFQLIIPVSNGYRLPTEAEWEFVASAASSGKPLKYPWGKELPVRSGTANVGGSEALDLLGSFLLGHQDEFAAVTAPALFAPNALGFFDFAGNVSEWVNDRYLSYVPSTAQTDPLGPEDGKFHTLRGSSWRTTTTAEMRFPWREGAAAANDSIGFRVARYVAPNAPQ